MGLFAVWGLPSPSAYAQFPDMLEPVCTIDPEHVELAPLQYLFATSKAISTVPKQVDVAGGGGAA